MVTAPTYPAVLSRLLAEPIWLAPMAGVGDPVLRGLCREQGAGLTFTEMVSAKGLEMGGRGTWDLVVLAPGETCAGVQIFGSDPGVMAAQATRIHDRLGDGLAILDINMGCPVPKVVRRGEGAALMRTPVLAAHIVEAVVATAGVPVSVKFRRGWEDGSDTAVSFARLMEDAGASLVSVHGRSAVQMYRGRADWSLITRVKEAVSIPVMGNGDLRSLEDAHRAMEMSGVDGVLIARGAEGNPWVFSGVVPTVVERLEMARRHATGLCLRYPHDGVGRMRKHMAWYTFGLPHAAALRERVMHCHGLDDYIQLIDDVERSLADGGGHGRRL